MKKKTAIITGIAGQDGAYLARLLVEKGYRVAGISLHTSAAHCWRLAHLGVSDRVELLKGDVSRPSVLAQAMKRFLPDEWYNLSAVSSVALSWEDPATAIRVNVEAVVSMLEIIRRLHPKTKFFQASSAEIYGNLDTVITEDTDRFSPVNPYGIAKLAAHQSVRAAREHHGLFAVNGILFNHESPLRQDVFVSKKITRGVARIACGMDDHIDLGNVHTRRNWAFAGDVAEAMWRMLQQASPSDFVICSDENHTIADFVRAAFYHAGIRQWKSHIRIARSLVRKNDVKDMRGSARRAARVLGWEPTVDFSSLVGMMVDYELEHLGHHKTP